MNFKEVQELIKLINKSNLTEFKMEKADFKISIRTKKYGRLLKNQGTNTHTQSIVPVATTHQVPMQQMQAAPPVAAPPAPESTSSNGNGKDAAPAEANNFVEVKSPIVGTFYRSSSPDKDPFIVPGDTIQKGSVVCIVEAMKLFNEIESEVSGKVVKILVDDASPVEYDQPLFLVDPNG